MGIDLGKIMVTPRGDYQDYVEYDRLDLVAYQGSSYIALKPVEGITPSDDGEYWQLHGSGAYQCAKEAGYEGTEEEFRAAQAEVPQLKSDLTKYLPLTGGTLSGRIIYFSDGNGYVGLNNLLNAAFLTCRNVANDDTYLRQFEVATSKTCTLDYALVLRDIVNSSETQYRIFGEHNKPKGSYTGNGNSAVRSINTGGIGKLLLVYKANTNSMVLISPNGAIEVNSGSVGWNGSEYVSYNDGVLTLKSTSSALNANGATYNYLAI